MTETLKVKIKKLATGVSTPKKAHSADAGFDLTATSKKLANGGYVEYGTSIAIQLPKNHVGLLFPRSSISKINMTMCNSVGVLDENYTGEVTFRFKPSSAGKGMYEIGDRIGQIVIIPYPKIEFEVVDELNETERGTGGYGSTGLGKIIEDAKITKEE